MICEPDQVKCTQIYLYLRWSLFFHHLTFNYRSFKQCWIVEVSFYNVKSCRRIIRAVTAVTPVVEAGGRGPEDQLWDSQQNPSVLIHREVAALGGEVLFRNSRSSATSALYYDGIGGSRVGAQTGSLRLTSCCRCSVWLQL